tara:strand:- start:339 stop:695 length:357 start_codon:yes stop_codon:yes gene_type:complete
MLYDQPVGLGGEPSRHAMKFISFFFWRADTWSWFDRGGNSISGFMVRSYPNQGPIVELCGGQPTVADDEPSRGPEGCEATMTTDGVGESSGSVPSLCGLLEAFLSGEATHAFCKRFEQ